MNETVTERAAIGLRPKPAAPIDPLEIDVPPISKTEQRTVAHAIDYMAGCYEDLLNVERDYGPLYDLHVPRGASTKSCGAWESASSAVDGSLSKIRRALISMVLLACGRIASMPKDWGDDQEDVDVRFVGRHGDCSIRTSRYVITVSFEPFDEEEMHLSVVPAYMALKVPTAGIAKGGEK